MQFPIDGLYRSYSYRLQEDILTYKVKIDIFAHCDPVVDPIAEQ